MSYKLTRVKPHTPTSHIYTYLSSIARQVFGKTSPGYLIPNVLIDSYMVIQSNIWATPDVTMYSRSQ